jgi:predicted Na+-dependent transporter
MQRRVLYLILMVVLPVLVGQFAFDWINSDLNSAVSHLPTRAILILAVLLVWTAFWEYRDRKKRTVR